MAEEQKKDDKVISLPSDAGHRLAYLLRAIDTEERNFSQLRTEHKDNLERLHNLVYKVREELLTGQLNLIDIAQEVVAKINAGELNTPDVTVTAQVGKAV